jgi:hypothetical protein
MLRRKVSSIVVSIALIILSSPFAYAKYSGGSGTAGDPYQIANVADLLALAVNTGDYGKCFILISDIDLSSSGTFTTAVIAPDTDNSNHFHDGATFTGIFDGAGHKISNLTINTNGHGNSYLGLFGEIDFDSQIKNLGLENVSIIGGDNSEYYGGLIGYSMGNIDNCYAIGSIVAGYSTTSLGGLVGNNLGGTISNCFATCAVAGGDSVNFLGGLLGNNMNGSVSNCYATGTIAGGEFAGALGGLVGENTGSISNCNSTGNVTGGSWAVILGGLVGENYGSSSISNCYSSGIVRGGGDSMWIGGLVGEKLSGNISSCYFLKTSGPDNGYGIPLTNTQMKQQASFIDWDFVGETANGTDDIWSITEGVSYPKLTWQATPATGPDLIITSSVGISPNPVAAGSNLTVTYTVKNNGSGNATQSQTQIHVQRFLTTIEIFHTTPALTAGSSITENVVVPIHISVEAGAYTVYVMLDYGKSIGQSNVSNDTYQTSIGALTIVPRTSTGQTQLLYGGQNGNVDNGPSGKTPLCNGVEMGLEDLVFNFRGMSWADLSAGYWNGAWIDKFIVHFYVIAANAGLTGTGQIDIRRLNANPLDSRDVLWDAAYNGTYYKHYSFESSTTGWQTVEIGSSDNDIICEDLTAYLASTPAGNRQFGLGWCATTGAIRFAGSDDPSNNLYYEVVYDPFQVSNLTASQDDIFGIELNWTPPAQGAQLYNIYRSKDPSNFPESRYDYCSELPYIDYLAAPGKHYWYKVAPIIDSSPWVEGPAQTTPSYGVVPLQGEYPIEVTKCTITAGKVQGQDSITASGTVTLPADVNDIEEVEVTITSLADDEEIYTETLTGFDATAVNRTGKYKYSAKVVKGEEGNITSMTLDFRKGTFAITAKNIDLTGLACPFEIKFTMGSNELKGNADEAVVNGTKTIPTCLMQMYKDTLIVPPGKAKVKNSTKALSDSLSVSGEIAVEDIAGSNLTSQDVDVIWGAQTFTIPAGNFAAKTGHSYKCSKVPIGSNGVVTATIDLDKCTFAVSIAKANIDAVSGNVAFGIRFADFSEVAEVSLP